MRGLSMKKSELYVNCKLVYIWNNLEQLLGWAGFDIGDVGLTRFIWELKVANLFCKMWLTGWERDISIVVCVTCYY